MSDRLTDAETCPCCGCLVEIVSNGEGTNYYKPIERISPDAEVAALRARAEAAEHDLTVALSSLDNTTLYAHAYEEERDQALAAARVRIELLRPFVEFVSDPLSGQFVSGDFIDQARAALSLPDADAVGIVEVAKAAIDVDECPMGVGARQYREELTKRVSALSGGARTLLGGG